MHWYVKALTCSFFFDQLSEEQFLTNLSTASIGKFSQSDVNYKIDLDVTLFKEMWIEKHKVRREIESENPVRVALHEMCIAALEQTSKPDMTKLMNKPGQFHSFNIPRNSALDRKFREYLQLYMSGADLASKSENYISAEINSRKQTFSLANWDKPLRITLYNGGRVDLLIPTDKERTYIAHSG